MNEIRCPECGSDDVAHRDDPHDHGCRACGYSMLEPSGPVPRCMTGHGIAAAIDRGEMLMVQFLTGDDLTWLNVVELCDDGPRDAAWWRGHIGQIVVNVIDRPWWLPVERTGWTPSPGRMLPTDTEPGQVA